MQADNSKIAKCFLVLSLKGAAFHKQTPKSNLWRPKSTPLHEKQMKTNSSHSPSPGGSKTACEGPVCFSLSPVPPAVSPNPGQCPQIPGSVPHGPCQGGRDQGERRENSCPAVGPNTVEISPGELGDLQGQLRWKGENTALRKIRNFAQDSREGCEGTNIAFGGHLWQLRIFFLFLPVFF